jgi:hypothetical protein
MVHLTREFVGGTLAGLGLGLLTGCYIAAPSPQGLGLGWHALIILSAAFLVPIGATLARSAQRGKTTSPSRP